MTEINSFSFLMQHLAKNKRRGLLVLSGNQKWCYKRAFELLSFVCADHRSYWVSQSEPQHDLAVRHAQHNQLKRLLGNDVAHLVIDGWEGFSPDGLAMASGTLSGGGLLLLLLPDLETWQGFEDPDYSRFKAMRPKPYDMNGYFIARSCRFFKSLSPLQAHQWPTEELILITENSVPEGFSLTANPAFSSNNQSVLNDHLLPTSDQQDVIAAINHIGILPSATVLVEADRGRGKSVALGLAIDSLLMTTPLSVAVVSPLVENVTNLFSVIKSFNKFDDSRLSYHSIDDLLYRDTYHTSKATHFDLLVIDEAAAIPLPVLTDLSRLAPRVVFSTTLNGYEGSGRGFELRFKQGLSRQFEKVIKIDLRHPIRWSDDDPLEAFLNRFLMLDAARVTSNKVKFSEKYDYQITKVSSKELLLDEALLSAVFSLLMQAHYQTRPSDLRQLLDAPYIHLWVLECYEADYHELVGVLLCCEEGGFEQSDELLDLIARGQRRPKGNLLSQSLAQRSGQADWCHYRSLRVMRIAIDEEYRRRGLASQLISTMESYLTNNQYDYWGTSFGYHADLLHFWRSFDVDVVSLGLHRDKASGLRNVQVIKPMSDSLDVLSDQAIKIFGMNLMAYKSHYLTDLCDSDVNLLIGQNVDQIKRLAASNFVYDNEQLLRFLNSEITFDQFYPALRTTLAL